MLKIRDLLKKIIGDKIMTGFTMLIGVIVYLLNEWITSYSNQLKYYKSSLSLTTLIISGIFLLLFWELIILHIFESESWHVILAIGLPFMLAIQIIVNTKTYFQSKRFEKILINTIKYSINTQNIEQFTVNELISMTGIEEYYELERMFNNAKQNGDIPHTVALITE
jgi:F0F1-type ATP synthase assembly protein I